MLTSKMDSGIGVLGYNLGLSMSDSHVHHHCRQQFSKGSGHMCISPPPIPGTSLRRSGDILACQMKALLAPTCVEGPGLLPRNRTPFHSKELSTKNSCSQKSDGVRLGHLVLQRRAQPGSPWHLYQTAPAQHIVGIQETLTK